MSGPVTLWAGVVCRLLSFVMCPVMRGCAAVERPAHLCTVLLLVTKYLRFVKRTVHTALWCQQGDHTIQDWPVWHKALKCCYCTVTLFCILQYDILLCSVYCGLMLCSPQCGMMFCVQYGILLCIAHCHIMLRGAWWHVALQFFMCTALQCSMGSILLCTVKWRIYVVLQTAQLLSQFFAYSCPV